MDRYAHDGIRKGGEQKAKKPVRSSSGSSGNAQKSSSTPKRSNPGKKRYSGGYGY